ncbi:MAG TPA: SUMF1/EgtB/PvdO family nonheme iron enzyme [Tepidisphaeraceae bacterium]|jgi:hypothetical protein|nr:SUMF1/EgtB/PvdO family nonheme iron enzyme [Tepidisphaeraceae bacterium]
MRKFGEYLAGESIGLSGAVVHATRAGDTSSYAIKFTTVSTSPNGKQAEDQLLATTSVTKQLQGKFEWIVTVCDSGRSEHFVWRATRYFPVSVDRLIINGMISAQEMAPLILAIGDALLEFFNKTGRRHGNLKGGNVLLASRSDLLHPRIYLSDPSPIVTADDAAAARTERQALGRIIYELVVRLPLREQQRSVFMSEKWKRLGEPGKKWCDWCNSLLDPQSPLTLEAFLGEVRASRAGKKSPGYAVCAVIMLLAVGAGVSFVANKLGHRTAVVNHPQAIAVPLPSPPSGIEEWRKERMKILTRLASGQIAAARGIDEKCASLLPAPNSRAAIIDQLQTQLTSARNEVEIARVESEEADADKSVATLRDSAAIAASDLVSAFMTDLSRTTNFRADPANEVWEQFKSSVNQSFIDSMDSYTLLSAPEKMKSVFASLGELSAHGVPTPLAADFKYRDLRPAVEQWLRARATSDIGQSIKRLKIFATPERLDGSIATEKKRLTDDRQRDLDDALAFAVEYTAVKTALENFYGLDASLILNNGANSQTIGGVIRRWESAGSVWEYAKNEPPCNSLAQLIQTLVQVSSDSESPDKLRAWMASPSARPEVLFAAWSRLTGRGYQKTNHMLEEADWASRLRTKSLASNATAERKSAVVSGVQNRWCELLNTVPVGKEMESLISDHAKFGITSFNQNGTSNPFVPYSSRSRFNVMLHESGLPASRSDPAKSPALLQSFARNVEEAGLDDAAVKATLAKIDGWLAAARLAPDEKFKNIGPGAVGWTASGAADGASVTYKFKRPAAQTWEIHMLRVVTAVGKSSYLATTEFPVDLAARPLIDSHGAAALEGVRRLLDQPRLDQPAGWTLKKEEGEPLIERSKIWFVNPGPGKAEPANKPLPKPDENLPMQNVSASEAESIAHLLHCRLATLAEWRAASKLAGARPETPNLPGRKLDEYLGNVGALLERQLADRAHGPLRQAARPPLETADVLWFRPVDYNDLRFHDLVGNVAEWVASGTGEKSYSVVGGSSLSVGIDPAKEIPQDDPEKHMCDVGFRLAMDAPPMAAAMDPITYLPP